MAKAKFTLGLAATLMLVQLVTAELTKYMFDDTEYDQMMITYFPRGQITEFTNNEEFCTR